MKSSADAILESLIGEVETKYGGPVDISTMVAKSDTKPKDLPPPKLLTEKSKDKKKKEKKKKDEKKDNNNHDYVKPVDEPWQIEPIKKMPLIDDIPIGGDFTLYHPKIKDSSDIINDKSKKEKRKSKDKAKSSEKRKDKERKHKDKKHKHKKKSKKDEEKEKLDMVPAVIERNNSKWENKEKEKPKDVDEGEIVEDNHNSNWMKLKNDKKTELLTPEEIQRLEIEKRKKAKKKLKKEKEKLEKEKKRKEDEEKEKKSKETEKKKLDEEAQNIISTSHYYVVDDDHRSKSNDRDRDDRRRSHSRHDDYRYSADKQRNDKYYDDYRIKDDYRDRYRNDYERNRDRSPRLKASGSLLTPLTPKKDSLSKILPQTWSKRLNTLLKKSNDEFTDKRRDDRREHRRRSVDIEVREEEIPKRAVRSRSRTPSVGRGRNFFRRTDEEWKKHQIDRIKKRKLRQLSPIQIFEEDYTDRDGNVNKKKLMDLATKNVTKLAMSGALPKGYELLTTIKNKTVNQLIDLCRQIHNEDERARADRSSSDESEDEGKFIGSNKYWEENRDEFFSLKEPQEAPKPRYDIIDGIPQQVKTLDERRADEHMLRVSYPVSSGYEHRLKESEPQDDDIPDLQLLSALSRIKTNIPPPFEDSFESQILSLCGPKEQLTLPAPESSMSIRKPELPIKNEFQMETLSKPIEISRPTDTTTTTTNPISEIIKSQTVENKPIKVRASFLKSGKKAAEEVLQKIITNEPSPVPHPDNSEDIKTTKSEDIVNLLNVIATVNEKPTNVLVNESKPIIEKNGNDNHTIALSALLDKVDNIINTGNLEKLAIIEKKNDNNNEIHPSPVKSDNDPNDYVKIPGIEKVLERERKEAEKIARKETKERERIEKERKELEEKRRELESTNLFNLFLELRRSINEEESMIIDETEKKEKKKKKKHKKDKKHDLEEGEIDEEYERKRKEKKEKKKRKKDEDGNEIPSKKSKSLEYETSKEFIGPKKAEEFNHRDPLPFIQALTGPQLAIEAPKSLKAEWNDPRNPLTAPPVYIDNDESMPLPFRIVPPPREPVVKPDDMVFKTTRCITHPPRMINELLSRRAKYAQALLENPNDYYAKNRISDIDREMSAWAESKNIPGKFTGRTGARVLSAEELGPSDPRYNAWARKDLFSSAPECESEYGRKIMEKYGWQKGAGLGKQMSGPVEPLKLGIKADRRGLAAVTDRKPGKNAMIADINGKNPISLVMEFCAKKRLQPPTFTCIESGPASCRRFLWKCTVDNVEYEPAMASGNKKSGKTEVCYVVLQALGQIPPTIPD